MRTDEQIPKNESPECVRVLIVEDSEADAILMESELHAGGARLSCSTVKNVEELASALGGEWDLILIDCLIPGWSGIEALRDIRAAGVECPAIMVSGLSGEALAIAAMKAGANDYLSKSNLSSLASAARRELKEYGYRKRLKLAEEEGRLLSQLIGTVSEINQLIVREKDHSTLLNETCRILSVKGGFPKAAVRLDGAGAPEPSTDSPSGAEEVAPPGKEAGLKATSFPFRFGKTSGSLDVYSSGPEPLKPSFADLLQNLADNIAYALSAIEEEAEKKAVLEALRESEGRLRTVFETAMDGMFIIDMDGRYIDVNQAGLRMFGYAREEFLSSDIRLLMFPESADKIEAQKLYWKNGAFLPEARLRKKDGEAVWVDMAITPLRIGDNDFALGVKRDVTGRRRSEEAIRESEERFRLLFEQNQDAQFIIEPGSCRILGVNPAAEALFGYSKEELIEAGAALIFGGRKDECERVAVELKTNCYYAAEPVENLRKDGARLVNSIQAQIIMLKDGAVAYCTVRDITGRVCMEEKNRVMQAKLIHANKMTSIGTLASGVAHEINNPNNFILFNSTLLTDAWKDASRILGEYYSANGDFSLGGLPYSEMCEVIPELLSGITDGSRRIKGIVDNLKDFSRAGRAASDGDLDANRAVLAAVSILNTQIYNHTDRFEVSCGEGIPCVRGSEQKIEQVVINLILNALHALPERSRGVFVSTLHDREGRSVVITVADEGEGMAKDVLERVTEPFFTTKSDSGGTGLGLSISYSIVKEHKGTIEFDSAPGKGTRVTVRLPVA